MAEKKKSIHTGHRERVKTEFLAQGIEGWPDHRILELLLFYAIPQGDVNPLAHELIDRFGTLDRVLDALPGELKKVKGMGDHSVTLLKLLPAVLGRYMAGRTAVGQLVQTTAQAGRALAPYLYGVQNETVYILCLDAKEKVLGVRKLSEGNICNSDVNVRRAAEECMALRASYCYLAHNHVSGVALPSPDDMNTTKVVSAALEPLGVGLVDHLVFVDGELVSVKDTEATGKKGGYELLRPSLWQN